MSVMDKKVKNQDASGEAGVDPQMDQLNIAPDPKKKKEHCYGNKKRKFERRIK
jgi:hypothetical protein